MTLPTDLLEMDENPLTCLDSVLDMPEPLSPPQLKVQPTNILKAAKQTNNL
ncbi:MAG: hypothetical protein WBG73_02530 [Coleofasciculaceae cyanobacterium]